MKHIKKFETVAAFEAVQATLDKPNVSYVTEIGGVNYLPYIPPVIETKLIVKYNVTDTEEDTPLYFGDYLDHIDALEIDGIEQNEVISSYRFDTTGEHVVKFTLPVSDVIYSWTFAYTNSITEIIIPSIVTQLSGAAFGYCSNLSSITCNAMTAPTLFDDKGSYPFTNIAANGTLYVPTGSTGYDTWLAQLGNGWTKVEQ